MEISGFVYFAESQVKTKAAEIKTQITQKLDLQELDVFRYSSDSEELYKVDGETEKKIDEGSLENSLNELKFLAACIKIRVP